MALLALASDSSCSQATANTENSTKTPESKNRYIALFVKTFNLLPCIWTENHSDKSPQNSFRSSARHLVDQPLSFSILSSN